MNFEDPRYLILLLVIPLYIVLKWKKKLPNTATLPFPWLNILKNNQSISLNKIIPLIKDGLLLASIACLIIALARPRGGSAITSENNLGVDIILTTDISGSMYFVDEPSSTAQKVEYFGQEHLIDSDKSMYSNSRLEISKRVITHYINKQEFNRIGLVLFSRHAVTKAPLSSDKELLKSITSEIQISDDSGATAIGTGILTAINRLRYSTAKSKVIILLTDGINNAGFIAPITAANIARELGIKIYTIGIGSPEGTFVHLGSSRYIYQPGQEFDAETLQEIARITGGKFFEAQNENALEDVYDAIDKLEKSEFTVKKRVLYEEKFKIWINTAITLLALWIILNTIILKIP